jgi:hypothetical protein
VLTTEHSYQYCEYSRKPREVQQSANMKPGRYLRSVNKSGLGFLQILTHTHSFFFHPLCPASSPCKFQVIIPRQHKSTHSKSGFNFDQVYVFLFTVTEERDWTKDRCHSTYRMWTTTNQWQWFSLHFSTWLWVATSLLQVESSWWHKTTRYVWKI